MATTFPLFWVNEDGSCGCGNKECKQKGSHPYVYTWRDLKAGEHVTGDPRCHAGVCTGARSGFFVVDLDRKNGVDGVESFRRITQPYGGIPVTFAVQTPSGGLHLYFLQPPDVFVKTRTNAWAKSTAKEDRTGIDIRGDGGMVVSPGKIPNRGEYKIVKDVSMIPAPGWLLALLEARPVTDETARKELLETTTARAFEGSRNAHLTTRAGVFRQAGLEREELTAALKIINVRDCSPPLPDPEVEAIARSVSRYKIDHPIPPAFFMAWPLKRETAPALPAPPAAKEGAPEYTVQVGDVLPGEKEPIGIDQAANELRTHEEWKGVLRFDEFSRRIVAYGPPIKLDCEDEDSGLTDADVTRIRLWFMSRLGLSLTKDAAWDVIPLVAQETPYHPIRDYLDALPPGDPEILKGLAARLFGDPSPMAQKYLEITLVGAVRRIYEPGVKFDTVLVLGGEQQAGKSTWIEDMFGRKYTRSGLPALDKADASAALAGYWGIELGEMRSILAVTNETAKDFISRPIDRFRPPYGRAEKIAPRQCAFIGTTNNPHILNDPSGDRRYLPIWIPEDHLVPREWVQANRDLIWAAARDLARTDFVHFFKRDEMGEVNAHRATFVNHDPWHEHIEEMLAGREFVRVPEIAKALGVDTAKLTHREQGRITDSLRRLGCKAKVKWLKGRSVRVWLTPPGYQDRELTPEEAQRRAAAGAVEAMLSKSKGEKS